MATLVDFFIYRWRTWIWLAGDWQRRIGLKTVAARALFFFNYPVRMPEAFHGSILSTRWLLTTTVARRVIWPLVSAFMEKIYKTRYSYRFSRHNGSIGLPQTHRYGSVFNLLFFFILVIVHLIDVWFISRWLSASTFAELHHLLRHYSNKLNKIYKNNF